jgi:hypothetical protein
MSLGCGKDGLVTALALGGMSFPPGDSYEPRKT